MFFLQRFLSRAFFPRKKQRCQPELEISKRRKIVTVNATTTPLWDTVVSTSFISSTSTSYVTPVRIQQSFGYLLMMQQQPMTAAARNSVPEAHISLFTSRQLALVTSLGTDHSVDSPSTDDGDPSTSRAATAHICHFLATPPFHRTQKRPTSRSFPVHVPKLCLYSPNRGHVASHRPTHWQCAPIALGGISQLSSCTSCSLFSSLASLTFAPFRIRVRMPSLSSARRTTTSILPSTFRYAICC